MNAPSIQMFPAQVADMGAYFRNNPEIARSHGLALAESGAPLPGRPETYTYHLGNKPTPGRGYDDRLTVRMGLSRSTLQDELLLWKNFHGKRGGLRHSMGGNKYWVTEEAIREWFGDRPIAQAA